MVALSESKAVRQRAAGDLEDVLGANQTVYAGSLLMRNASGHLIKGAVATGSFGVGVAVKAGSSTTAGVTRQRYREGVFLFVNSTGGDAIAQADVGAVCYIVDDQTVAKTNGGSTRSPAGAIRAVDTQGVWVEVNETLTRALVS
jgi:hypothetical protein